MDNTTEKKSFFKRFVEAYKNHFKGLSKTKKILTVTSNILTIILILVLITQCAFSPNTPEQNGYEIALEDLKDSLIVPKSLKVTEVNCYYSVMDKYSANPDNAYCYLYKIHYSCKNGFDDTVNKVVYYGYNDENKTIKYYGENSSVWNNAISSPGNYLKVKK